MNYSSEKGITLTEILVTLAITAIVSTLLVSIFTKNNQLFYNQQTKVSHGISSNEVINQIDDAIRGAISVEAQYPTLNPIFTSSSSTLILKLASIDSNGNVISGSYDYLVFSEDPTIVTILRRHVFPSAESSRTTANQVITTNLKSLEFNYQNDSKQNVNPPQASLVTYTLSLQSQQGNAIVESSASGQTRLRNN